MNSNNSLRYRLNHIILPPKLPQQDDSQATHDYHLCQFMTDSLKNYALKQRTAERTSFDEIAIALQHLASCHDSTLSSEIEVAASLSSLGKSGFRIFHIKEQNAAVLVRSDLCAEKVIIECFEVLPPNRSVMTVTGALVRSFPRHAIGMTHEDFHEPLFKQGLARFLFQAATTVCSDFQSRSKKAGVGLREERDTVDPALITDMLVALLEANGTRVALDEITKRTFSDVIWNDAKLPWHRSPLWLVLRVSLQRIMRFTFGADMGHKHYKNAVAFLISELCHELSLPNFMPDIIVFAETKLARRIHKMKVRGQLFHELQDPFRQALRSCQAKVQEEWTTVQTDRKVASALSDRIDLGNVDSACHLTLAISRSHLNALIEKRISGTQVTPIELQSPLRNRVQRDGLPVPLSATASCFDKHVALSDFESWVRDELEEWEQSNTPSEALCARICSLIRAYQTVGQAQYVANIDQLSLMILTVLELWCVLDRFCTTLHSELSRFHPEIPSSYMDHLCLPRQEQMERLHTIEKHVKARWLNHPRSAFEDPRSGSLASKVYEHSPNMQALHQKILSDDRGLIAKKEAEWKQKKDEHDTLLSEYNDMECTYETKRDWAGEMETVHNQWCARCHRKKMAEGLKISLHESSLPSDKFQAEAVVFELNIPPALSDWREMTWNIVQDLGRKTTVQLDPELHVLLRDYHPLARYRQRFKDSRVALGSKTKSFLVTHYGRMAHMISAVSLTGVCVPNGLQFRLRHSSGGYWIDDQDELPGTRHHCSPKLPAKSLYSSILPAIESVGTTPNHIVASQYNCPAKLSQFEYQAFQEVRSSAKLQWEILLRELASKNIDFSTQESSILFCHAATQVGTNSVGNTGRDSHWQLTTDEFFCLRLCEQLSLRLDSIEANWKQRYCLKTVVVILLRILSLSNSESAQNHSARLLVRARKSAFAWVEQLQSESKETSDERRAAQRKSNAISAAFLCRRTFETYLENPAAVFSRADLTAWIRCAILIRSETPPSLMTMASYLRAEAIHDRKLALQMELHVRDSALAHESTLSAAIASVWSSFHLSGDWTSLPAPNERWLTSKSQLPASADIDTAVMLVHYDVLSGSLLVNGITVGVLPSSYMMCANYSTLFQNRCFDVYPSSVPGMTFVAATEFGGNEACLFLIHFGMRTEDDLQVRLRHKGTGAMLEYIPVSVFQNPRCSPTEDLPHALTEGCTHWLDLNTRVLEIRSLQSWWEPSITDWRMGTMNIMTHLDETLVDVRSALFSSVAKKLESIETSKHLLVYLAGDGTVWVRIPRYDLRFIVTKDGQLYCPEFGAVVDDCQDVGTLYGLQTKLVLSTGASRLILIPKGEIQFSLPGSHVNVTIIPKSSKVTYVTLTVNSLLGRLDCEQDLYNIFFKAYLHAITAFPLPDPLTGRTGTDEALNILRSGSARPWSPLDMDCMTILASISKLTPTRFYYPSHLTDMQQVNWISGLHISSQHDDFVLAVEALAAISEQTRPFFPQSESQLPKSKSNAILLERSRARNALHRSPQSCFNACPTPQDVVYISRNTDRDVNARSRVFEIATLVRAWSTDVLVTKDLMGAFEKLGNICGFDVSLPESLDDQLHLDFSANWGSMQKFFGNAQLAKDKASVMFIASTIAFGRKTDMDLLRTVLAFAFTSELRTIARPPWSTYSCFIDGQQPNEAKFRKIIANYCKDFVLSSTIGMSPKQKRDLKAREQNEHSQKVNAAISAFYISVMAQWPAANIDAGRIPAMEYLPNPVAAIAALQPHWTQRYHNYRLANHVREIQVQLDLIRRPFRLLIPGQPACSYPIADQSSFVISRLSMDELLQADYGAIITPNVGKDSFRIDKDEAMDGVARSPTLESLELRGIISLFLNSDNGSDRNYGKDLEASLRALDTRLEQESIHYEEGFEEVLQCHRMTNEVAVNHRLKCLRKTLSEHPAFEWLQYGPLFPCLTPVTLLSSLNRERGQRINPRMSTALLQYALQITCLQRSRRLERMFLKKQLVQLNQELIEVGHEDWKIEDHPEWLLFEIESDLLIRRRQYVVAQQIMRPDSGTNSALQLNMGEGKSSVIVPMVVLSLASDSVLSRVVVPKPLLLQMCQILSGKLGGLLNRSVFHLPYSRATRPDMSTAKTLRKIYDTCMETHGVLLALPEHILSFKLNCQERLLEMDDVALALFDTHQMLDASCRDVIDECDQVLAVQVQLVYPSGSQLPVDGHPLRWRTTEAVLEILKKIVLEIGNESTKELRVVSRPYGGYPDIFILRQSIVGELTVRLGRCICQGEGQILPVNNYSKDKVSRLFRFITEKHVSTEISDELLSTQQNTEGEIGDFLLLRGLLAFGILFSSLQKRWNVSFGLDLRRCRIAVPYLAKGIPTPASEFGHPDVAILLTCFSYFYAGLTFEQFRLTLEMVFQLDDPIPDYEAFVIACGSLPSHLQAQSSINLDDESQIRELWSYLGHTTKTVEYFLNYKVFPEEAKGFEKKLTTSAWDLPLIGETMRVHNSGTSMDVVDEDFDALCSSLTTGFSGTNDFKDLLPMSIRQNDLPSLVHTNAQVLTTLLQPRNRSYKCASDSSGLKLGAKEFLELVNQQIPQISIILDAGAFVLEMGNKELVTCWLQTRPKARAAVFFDDQDRLMVLHQDSRIESLSGSSYASLIDETCLLFLDQVHTRGTDLKLPADARAALTVGDRQTKDHTVQAAMRLRSLVYNQSVMWFAPPEVEQKIKDLENTEALESPHIIRWILQQTCLMIDTLRPLFISQGLGYCKRERALQHHLSPALDGSHSETEKLVSILEEPESYTLRDMYGPEAVMDIDPSGSQLNRGTLIGDYETQLVDMRRKMVVNMSLAETTAHEQQERELSVEKEEQRLLERPLPVKPLTHVLHSDVVAFVRSGVSNVSATGYKRDAMAAALRNTVLGSENHCTFQIAGNLLTSTDFLLTVSSKRVDEYQRAVNWVLFSTRSGEAMVINAFEADGLLHDLLRSPYVHLLIYSAPISQKTLHFDNLTFRSIPQLPITWKAPAWLVRALGIFAGRLYFGWEEYGAMCAFLGLPCGGDVKMEEEDIAKIILPVCDNPLDYAAKWLSLRRKGQDFSINTPMGLLCRKRMLTSDHPFFSEGRHLRMIKREEH